MKVAYDISKELAKRGHEVQVLTTNAYDQTSNFKPKSKEQVVSGFQVTYFSNLLRFSNIYLSPEMIVALRKKLKEFDVVHTHYGRQPYDVAVGFYAKKYGVPYVLQAHGSLPRMEKRYRQCLYDTAFGYRILKNASKVIALSEVEAEQYRRVGVPEEKIAIIPNGIDFSEYADLPLKGSFKKKFNIPENNRIILYLGRIHKTKGIDLLVKAYAYLVKSIKYNDALLVIAGPDDGYLAEIKSLSAHLNVSDSVLFTGFISSSDKLKALVDADVFVTPSFYGFPVTFLEACATRTPIVTTNLGDTLDWIDGNVGYVTPPLHCDLAKAIYAIISDDELHRKFSRNCTETVRSDFSLNTVVTRLEKVYEVVTATVS